MKGIQILRKLERDTPAELYYAGEYARDIVRRKRSAHIQIVSRNIQLKDVIKYLKQYVKNIHISREKSCIKFGVGGTEIDISLPRKGKDYNPYYSLRDDAKTRGFTINAMYIPVNGKRKPIDYYRGRNSIQSRKIKSIGKSELAIKRNPLLMMQSISLAAELNYRIDNNLFYATKANFELIDKVPVENIRDELITILLSQKPSRYLKVLYDSGLMNIVLPELSIGAGVAQNKKYHKYNVFDHCTIACDNMEPDIILRLTALFHDLGKPQTRDEVIKKGVSRVTFYNHEVVGSKVAKKALKRLKFDKKIVDTVSDLIYNHMYNYEHGKWSESNIRKLIKKAKIIPADLERIDTLHLFLLRKADRVASGLDLREVSSRQYALQERIKKVYAKSKALHIADLDIDGAAVMETFNLRPGPTIGHVLNYLLSMVIEDQKLNKRDKLIEEASKYLSKALK